MLSNSAYSLVAREDRAAGRESERTNGHADKPFQPVGRSVGRAASAASSYRSFDARSFVRSYATFVWSDGWLGEWVGRERGRKSTAEFGLDTRGNPLSILSRSLS